MFLLLKCSYNTNVHRVKQTLKTLKCDEYKNVEYFFTSIRLLGHLMHSGDNACRTLHGADSRNYS